MRVLVVEDFAVLRESLTKGLTNAGIAVDATGDGIDGLRLARENAYDLLILDIMVPGRSGLEITSEVRKAGSDVPILILTALDDVDDRVRGLDMGADDYLAKPFAIAELLARVRSLTRRNGASRSPLLKVADLVIDTISRTAQRNSLPIGLTPREYALLEFLARRAGNTVTRAEIIANLYSTSEDATFSNVIDATIARLRRKVDPQGSRQLIQTRRGFGYVLTTDEATA